MDNPDIPLGGNFIEYLGTGRYSSEESKISQEYSLE
jgi:hypothetical protein